MHIKYIILEHCFEAGLTHYFEALHDSMWSLSLTFISSCLKCFVAVLVWMNKEDDKQGLA